LPDDLGLSHQHIHQVTARHQVKQEVQVVLVLQAAAAVMEYCTTILGLEGHQVTARHQVKQEVQVVLVLQAATHIGSERVMMQSIPGAVKQRHTPVTLNQVCFFA
jgi:ABC-type hemin transport system ATPase subunit